MPYKDRDKQREYQRKWTARRRVKANELGLCPGCGTREAVPGYKECKWCRDNKYRDRVKNKEREKKSIKIRRQKYKEQGRCTSCSRPLIEEGVNSCMICRDKGESFTWR